MEEVWVDNILETQAKISFSFSFELQEGYQQDTIEFDGKIGSNTKDDFMIEFSGVDHNNKIAYFQGYTILKNLLPGTEYESFYEFTCDYIYTTWEEVWIEGPWVDEWGNEWSGYYDWVEVNNPDHIRRASTFGPFYTHPGAWNWEDYISSGDIIQKTLKADYINKWVNHLVALKKWEAQDDQTLDADYKCYYENGYGYMVNSGDLIYLQWFNNCLSALGKETITRNNNDIISLDNFKKLNISGIEDTI